MGTLQIKKNPKKYDAGIVGSGAGGGIGSRDGAGGGAVEYDGGFSAGVAVAGGADS